MEQETTYEQALESARKLDAWFGSIFILAGYEQMKMVRKAGYKKNQNYTSSSSHTKYIKED